jgi:crotonobetainyl-CoA hydratase
VNAVLTKVHDHVLIATIDRPDAMNAINADVATELGEAVERAEREDDIRVLILTGSGERAFSAGADLKAIARGESIQPRDHPEWGFAGYVRHFTSTPTIAAVNGLALGGGTELCLASDMVIAVDSAQFGLPEVKRGILAAAGGAFRLPRQIPPKIAMEMLLTGRSIDAPTAHRWGLVNHVTTHDELLPTALALAAEIAANAPLSVRSSKRIAYGVPPGGHPDEDAFWELNTSEYAAVRASDDAREGPRAFAEKRAPVWTGH